MGSVLERERHSDLHPCRSLEEATFIATASTRDMPTTLPRAAPHCGGFFTWRPTDTKQLKQSEACMLHGINYKQRFVAGLNTISSVDIPGDPTNEGRDIMVLIHGFAGGLACWAQNWEFFSAHYELHAIDLPGFGRSERPDVKIESLEDSMFFVCSWLERWFCGMNFLRPVILMGHSFGGYIAAHYTMKYGPARVKLLALADPWGVNEGDSKRIEHAPIYLRLAVKAFYAFNPLAPIRAVGPVGPKIFRMLRPDFADRWRGYLENPKMFYDYMYHCNAQLPPLGEVLFKACCHADIAAKTPLFEILPQQLSKSIPLAVLYGCSTWMNSERGFTMVEMMAKQGHRVKADTVMNAGHQVFMDNAPEFNEKALQAICELLQEACDKRGAVPDVHEEV